MYFMFQLPILELLVQNGADLGAKTKTGETPLGKKFEYLWEGGVCFRLQLYTCQFQLKQFECYRLAGHHTKILFSRTNICQFQLK